jgi:hypothetical protein
VNGERDTSSARASAPGSAPGADPCARLFADLCDLLRTMGPPEEARRHFRSARVEVLKGLRAVIDSRIQRLSTEPQKGASVPID